MKLFNNMNKLTLSLLAGSVCLSTLMPMSAFAEGGQHKCGGHKRPNFSQMTPEQKQEWKAKKEARHQKMVKELGLSPEQDAKLKAIREQNRSQAKAIHEQLRAKRKALMEYMGSDNAEPGKAKAMQQEVNQLQGQLSTLRLNTWFEMKKNLTPEQLAKMKELRAKHHKGHGKSGAPVSKPAQ